MSDAAELEFKDLLAIGARSLKPNEYWCITHPEGPLPETASKNFTLPPLTLCQALDMEWDDLVEQGYHLGKIELDTVPPLDRMS